MRRLLAAGALVPAAIFGPAMGGVPAHAVTGETAVSPDPRALRVAAVARQLSRANATLCAEMVAPRSELRVSANPTAHAEAALWQEPPVSTVEARVRPRMGAQDLGLAPFTICRAKVTLIEDVAVNAWADGKGIVLTTGLLARCKSESDLALVLGHEMAHNLLQHQHPVASPSTGTHALRLTAGGTAQYFHETEEAADRFAIRLAMAAGYDLTGVEAFMEGLLDHAIVDSQTHPDTDRRLALLRAAIAEAQRIGSHQLRPLAS